MRADELEPTPTSFPPGWRTWKCDQTLGLHLASLDPESERGLAWHPSGVLHGTEDEATWPPGAVIEVEGKSSELGVPGPGSGIQGPAGGIEARLDPTALG